MLEINGISDGRWMIGCLGDNQSVHTARLVGTLDEHTVGQIKELSQVVFNDDGFSDGDNFLIDLSGVKEIDHVGIAALMGILVGLSAKAGSLGLILPLEHPVRRALRVTGLERIFDLYETSSAAHDTVDALFS